jgi:hypothetical protein
MRIEAVHVAHHGQRGFLVVLAFGQVQQFAGFAQAFFQAGDAVDVLFQAGTFAAQGLGVLGVVPDIRAFQLAVYFFQTLALGVVVKDTPEANAAVPADRRCAGGWG